MKFLFLAFMLTFSTAALTCGQDGTGGIVEETVDNNGISALAAELLLKGTRRRDQQAIADLAAELESKGMLRRSFAGDRIVSHLLTTLSEARTYLANDLARKLRHPALAPRPLVAAITTAYDVTASYL